MTLARCREYHLKARQKEGELNFLKFYYQFFLLPQAVTCTKIAVQFREAMVHVGNGVDYHVGSYLG